MRHAAAPEKLVRSLTQQTGDETLLAAWRHELAVFRRNIKKQSLTLTLLDPAPAALSPETLCPRDPLHRGAVRPAH